MAESCDRLRTTPRNGRRFLFAAGASVLILTCGPAVDMTPAGATMRRLSATHDVVTWNGNYRPGNVILRSGDKIRFCNKDSIYYKPFTTKRSVGVVRFGTIAPGQCLTTPPFLLPRGRNRSQFMIGSEIQSNVRLAVTLLPAVGAQIPFSITSVNHPVNIAAGSNGALTVNWQGNPRFPVTMHYVRMGKCPPSYRCVNVSKTFASSANPLVYPGALFCGRASRKGFYLFPYAVYLVDANGARTVNEAASFYCNSP